MISFLGAFAPYLYEYYIKSRDACQAQNAFFYHKARPYGLIRRHPILGTVNSSRDAKEGDEQDRRVVPDGPLASRAYPLMQNGAQPRSQNAIFTLQHDRNVLSVTRAPRARGIFHPGGARVTRKTFILCFQPYLRSLLQKPLPDGAVFALPRSGWKIPHTSRVTPEKAPSGGGVNGILRLLCPSPCLLSATTGAGHASRELLDAQGSPFSRRLGRGSQT